MSRDPNNEHNIISSLINEFRLVNPSYRRLFGMKGQHNAIRRLLEIYDQEKLREIIRFLEVNNAEPFAPIIITPYVLEKEIGKLIAFWSRKRKNTKGKKLII